MAKKITPEEIHRLNTAKEALTYNDASSNVGDSQYNPYILDNQTNIEDARHDLQSNTSALTNSLIRNAGRLALRTGDSLAFIPSVLLGAAYNTISGNKKLGLDAIYDNPASVFFRDVEETITKALPIYRDAKAQEESFSGVGNTLGSITGLDMLIDGATYIASMGLARKGISKGAQVVSKYMPKIFEAAKNGETLTPDYLKSLFRETDDLDSASSVLGAITKNTGGNLKNKIQELAWDAWGGLVESAAEASETSKNIKENLTNLKLKENGGKPLTQEQIEDIDQKAKQGGSWNLLANMLVTTSANKLLYNKLLNNKWLDDVKKVRGINIGEAGEAVLSKSSLDKYTKYLGNNVLGGVVTEGGQEGIQYFTNDFITNVLSSPDLTEENNKLDYVKELGKSLSNTFNTNDGLESMIIGSIIGGGSGYLLNRTKDSAEDAEKQELIKTINDRNINTGTLYQNDAKMNELQKVANGALLNNDRFNFENVKAASLFSVVNAYDKIGKLDSFVESLKKDEELLETPDAFKEKYNLEELDKDSMKKKIINLQQDVKRIADTKNKILDNYGAKLRGPNSDKIVEALTLYKTYEDDFSNRESKLIEELKTDSNGTLDYLDFIRNKSERRGEIESEIKTLDGEIQKAKENKDLQTLVNLTDTYSKLNKELVDIATPVDYMKQFTSLLNNVDETGKEKTKHLRTNEFLQKIKDLEKIQQAKEDVFNNYSALINDEKSRKNLLENIKQKEYGKLYEDEFSLPFNTGEKTTDGKDIYERNLVKKGDVVKIKRNIKNKYGSKREFENEEHVQIEDTSFENSVDKDGNVVPKGYITIKNEDGTLDKIPTSSFSSNAKNAPRLVKYARAFEDFQKKLPEDYDEEQLKDSIKEEVENEFPDKNELYKEKVVETRFQKAKAKILSEAEPIKNLFTLNYNLPEWKIYNKAKGRFVKYVDEQNREHSGILVFLNGHLFLRNVLQEDTDKGKFIKKKGSWNNIFVNLNNKQTSLTIYTEEESIVKAIGENLIYQKASLEKFKEKENDYKSQEEKYNALIKALNDKINESISDTEKDFIKSRLESIETKLNKLKNKIKYYENIEKDITISPEDYLAIKHNKENESYKQILADNLAKYKEYISLQKEALGEEINNYNDYITNVKKSIEQEVFSNDLFDENGMSVSDAVNMDYISSVTNDGTDLQKVGEFMKLINSSIDPVSELLLGFNFDNFPYFDFNKVKNFYDDLKLKNDELQRDNETALSYLIGRNINDLSQLANNEVNAIDNFFKRASSRYYDYLYNTEIQTDDKQEALYTNPIINTRSTGNSKSTTNYYEERFYRNIQNVDTTKHHLEPVLDSEKSTYGYNNDEYGYRFKVVETKTGKITGVTTLPNPTVKKNQVGRNYELLKTVFDKYTEFFDPNSTLEQYTFKREDLKEVNKNKKDILKTYQEILNNSNDDNLSAIIKDLFENSIIPIIILRTEIQSQNLTGKSNEYKIQGVNLGVPIKTKEETPLKNFLNPDNYDRVGKEIVIKVANEKGKAFKTNASSYSLKDGFAYLYDTVNGSLIPIKTNKTNTQLVNTLLNGLITLKNEKPENRLNKLKELSVNGESTDGSVLGLLRRYFHFEHENKTTKLMYDISNDNVSLIYGFENGINKSVTFEDIFESSGNEWVLNNKGQDLLFYLTETLRHNIDSKLLTDEKLTDIQIDNKGNVLKTKTSKTYTDYLKDLLYSNVTTNYGNKFDNGYVVINTSEFSKIKIEKQEEPKKQEGKKRISKKVEEKTEEKETEDVPESDIPEPIQKSKLRPKTVVVEKDSLEDNFIESLKNLFDKKEDLDRIINVVMGSKDDTDTKKEMFIKGIIANQDKLGIKKENLNDIIKNIEKYYKDYTASKNDGDDSFFLEVPESLEPLMNDEDFKKAKDKFENAYKLPYEVVTGLVKGKAYGMVQTSGKVLLSNKALKGTDYHEEFHVVSNFALDKKERESIYKEWNKQNNKQLSNKEVEEELAEEFRYYILTNQFKKDNPVYKSFLSKVFDKILNFIKSLLSLNNSQKEKLFKDIKNGKYYGNLKMVTAERNLYSLSKDQIPPLTEINVADRNKIMSQLYDNYINLLFNKRKQEIINYDNYDFETKPNDDIIEEITKEANFEEFKILNLTLPEKYLLEKLIDEKGKSEGLKEFKQYNGFSSKNAIIYLLNNPSKLNDFYHNYKVKQGKDTVSVSRSLSVQSVIKSYNNDSEYSGAIKKYRTYFREQLENKINNELGFSNDSEFDEEVTSKEGVQEDSNTINHYELAQSKLKLILSDILVNKKTNEANKYKNVSEYLTGLFKFVDDLKSSDSDYFFKMLNMNFKAFSNAIGLSTLPVKFNKNDTKYKNLIAFQNNVFQYLSKQKLNYQILKINEREEYIQFVDALLEKKLDTILDRYISYFNINDFSKTGIQINGIKAIDSKGYTNRNVIDEIAKQMGFGSIPTAVNLLASNMNKINEAVIKNKTNDLRKWLKKTAEEELNKTNNVKAVYSLPTADGKSTYSIQNHSSLSKRFEEYREKVDKREINQNNNFIIFEGSELVPFSGIQTTLEKSKFDYDTGQENIFYEDDSEKISKLDEFDLIGTAYQGVLKAIQTGHGFIPFLFSGDKSSFWNFKFYAPDSGVDETSINDELVNPAGLSSSSKEYFTKLLDREISNYHAYIANKNKSLTYVKREGKDELPFYSFIKDVDSKFYEKLLSGNVTEEDKVQAVRLVNNKLINESLAIKEYFDKNSLKRGYGKENEQDFFKFSTVSTIALLEQSYFTGDLMYYKDFTKRIPALGSSKETLNLSKQSVNYFNSVIKNPEEEDIKADEMNALIINDIIVNTSDVEGGYNYSSNNVADAQGYISLHATKFMIWSSGRWNDDYEQLFNKYEKGNLKEDEVEKLYNSINEHLNAMKPQYYGFYESSTVPIFYKLSVVPLHEHYTKGKNLDHVREIMKSNNSHFVIFESGNKVGRKIINGNNLKGTAENFKTDLTFSLYDENKNYNPSLVNEKGEYLHIKDSQVDYKEVLKALNQKSHWKYNGIQVETNNQKSKVTFGTQMRTLALVDLDYENLTKEQITTLFENLDYDDNLSPKDNIVRTFDSLIEEKYNNDKEKLIKRLALKEENGQIEATDETINKIRETLIKASQTSGVTNEFINHLLELQSFDLISNKQKLQSIIQKMLDLTKQKVKGEPKVQVSSALFEKKDGNIQTDSTLKGYETDNGFYLEVYLPLENKEHYKNYLKDSPDEDGIWRFKEGMEQSVMGSVGFRIPTQYINAIDRVLIKGFVSGVARNQVIVPAMITTKTGSDFDVDKLNLFLPTFTYEKINIDEAIEKLNPDLKNSIQNLKRIKQISDKYNEEVEGLDSDLSLEELYSNNPEYIKELYENGEEDLTTVEKNIVDEIDKIRNKNRKWVVNPKKIDNKIIDFYSKLLLIRKQLVTKPNSEGIVKRTIKDVIEPARDFINTDNKKNNAFNLMWLLKRRISFMTAKSTLGIQALSGKHHALCQMYNIKVNNIPVYENSSVIARDLNTLLKAFNKKPKIKNGVFDFDRIYDQDGNIISQIISETIDATVDAAKDDYIASANFRNETANTFNFMLRIGISPDVILAFLSQPAITTYINEKRLRKSPFSNRNPKSEKPNTNVNYDGLDLTFSNLIEEIKNPSNKQNKLLNLFLELDKHASLLSDFTKMSTFDTKGIGTSIEENQAILNNYETNKDKVFEYFVNSNNMFAKETNKSFIEIFKNVSENANGLVKNFFQLETILPQKFVKTMNDIYSSKYDSNFEKAKTVFKLKELFSTYLIQQYLYLNGHSFEDIVVNLPEKIISIQDKIKNDFSIKNTNFNLKNNFLIEKLSVNLTKGKGDKNKNRLNTILMFNVAKLDKEESNNLTDSWKELYEYDKDLAKDLAVYTLYQSGTLNSPVSMYNIIPFDIKKELGIHNYDQIINSGLVNNEEILIKATNIATGKKDDTNIFDRFLLSPAQNIDDSNIIDSILRAEGLSGDELLKAKKVIERNGVELFLKNKKLCP